MRFATLTAAAALLAASPALADDHEIKIGVILGFSGPIESLTPDMAAGAELAMKEVTESGALLDGMVVTPVRADSTCTDAAAASSAAEKLITSDGVKAIMGADCSGVTTAVLKNVAMANGVVMISPSATSPALSNEPDDGLFFRTAPSDARQGEILAAIMRERGIQQAALTYTNNDYGKGLAEAIEDAFEEQGGEITISAPHEDGKGDYAAEVGALSAAGGDALVVAGYLDQGGKGVIQASLDTGAFDTFVLPDGMIGDALPEAIGSGLDGSFGTRPGSDSSGGETFKGMAEEAGFNPGPYAGESYDAAALLMLAMQAAGSAESADLKGKVMMVANEPGEQIFPGELDKALRLIAEGKDIDYVGATAVELIGEGESAGSYAEIEIENGSNVTQGYR